MATTMAITILLLKLFIGPIFAGAVASAAFVQRQYTITSSWWLHHRHHEHLRYPCTTPLRLPIIAPRTSFQPFIITPSSSSSSPWSKSATTTTTTTKRRATTTPYTSTCLRMGLAEWRDLFEDMPGASLDRRLGRTELDAPPKSICILPFPYQDVLLQGETKQLRLYEQRFIQLFDDAVQNHAGVVAMGLLADSGIIQTVPLCEIEASHRVDGFGIFVTVRVVSRARLMEIYQQEPYLKAVCVEINDRLPPNLELLELAASNIDHLVVLLASMEHQLEQAKKEQQQQQQQSVSIDDEMSRRIAIAKLENAFYDDLGDETVELDGHDNIDNENDDNDDGIMEDDEIAHLDCLARYRAAYQMALETDMQGYQIMHHNATRRYERSPAELTAISWAVFCLNAVPGRDDCIEKSQQPKQEQQDSTYRIQALDCDTLFGRLQLALQMLRSKKDLLHEQMKQAGLKFRDGNSESGAW